MVHLTTGAYYVASGSLRMGSNVHLYMDQDVELVRRYNGAGEVNALIRNKGFSVSPPDRSGNENIKVTGGRLRCYEYHEDYRGPLMAFVNAQWLTIDNVRFDGVYVAWNASFVDCQDVTVTRVVMNSGTVLEEDGLHFAGGARIVVSDCDIRCGDDAIALVQAAPASGQITQETDLVDFVATNCYLHSRAANAFKARKNLNAQYGISRVRISNVIAKAGSPEATMSWGIHIQDDNSGGDVTDIEMSDFSLDASENSAWGGYIRSAARVRLSNVVIRNPTSRVAINAVDGIDLIDCVVDNPRTAFRLAWALAISRRASRCAFSAASIPAASTAWCSAGQHLTSPISRSPMR